MEKFCKTHKTKYLEQLREIEKNTLVDYSFRVLFQKVGDQQLARQILEYYNQIHTVKGVTVYSGPKNLPTIQSLERLGVTTLPIIRPDKLPKYRKKFLAEMRKFPEYNRCTRNPDKDRAGNPLVYVLGGFSALGNPASFHNNFVRSIRQKAYIKMTKELFVHVIERIIKKSTRKKAKLEVLIDRMLFRRAGMKPTAESWHRDVMPKGTISPTDEIFGGWINLDDTPQYFSCVSGSHLGVRLYDLESGFDVLPKDLAKEMSKHKSRFIVPPGHCVIFPQYIVHEVVASITKHDMYRLFTGWRITTENKCLHKNIHQFLEKQAVIPLPGGMLPPMYSRNHGSLFLRRKFSPTKNVKVSLIDWSKNTFKKNTLINKNGSIIVERNMKSLQDYNYPKYKPYSKSELKMYCPHKIN